MRTRLITKLVCSGLLLGTLAVSLADGSLLRPASNALFVPSAAHPRLLSTAPIPAPRARFQSKRVGFSPKPALQQVSAADATSPPLDAVAREITTSNGPAGSNGNGPVVPGDAASRELTVGNSSSVSGGAGGAVTPGDAVSRELTVSNAPQGDGNGPVVPGDAASRELTVDNSSTGTDGGGTVTPDDAVSRELTVGNSSSVSGGGGGTVTAGDAVSREFTVNNNPAVDTVPPDTSITSGPGAVTCATTVTFTFTGTDNITTVPDLRYVYRLDGGAWSAVGKAATVTLQNLTIQSHTFEVAAIDLAGNQDLSPAKATFVVDNTPPTISLLTVTGVSPTIAGLNWTTGKPANSTSVYRLQGTTVWTAGPHSDAQVTNHTLQVMGLTPGQTYELMATSADSCGDASSTRVQAFTLAGDTTPPTTSISSGPADGSPSCASTVTFSFTGADDVTPTSALTYETSLDGAAFSAPSTATSVTLSHLTNGAHIFVVKAVDGSGNVDPVGVTILFTVDTAAPVITAVAAAPRDVKATVTWTTDKPTGSQIEYGLTTAYGSLTTLDTNLVTSHSEIVTGLTPLKVYHYRVHSKDACHETISPDQTFTTAAIQLPNLEVTQLAFPASVQPGQTITVNWTVQNLGPGDAGKTWNDGVYLSPTNTVTAQSTLLGKFNQGNALVAGDSYAQSQSLTLPRLPAGSYYVIVVADDGNVIKESSETDNTLAMPISFLMVQSLVVSPSQTALSLNVGVPQTATLALGNLSSAPMTSITATVVGAASNIQVQVAPPSVLAAMSGGQAQVTVTATDASTLTDPVTVNFTDAQGDAAQATLNLTVIPPMPVLIASPSPVSQGMVRGQQTLVEVTVTNTGALTATNLAVKVPAAPWLALASPVALGDLAPGASAKIVLLLTPTGALPLGAYTGTVALSGSNANLLVPFAFNCISLGKGDLKVVAQDEFSFFADTHPNIAGAHVVVSDYTTGAVVVNDVTGPDGILLKSSLPEGDYNVDVTADGHAPYHGTLHLVAGQTNEIDPFLSRQLVTYTWNVVPIPFTDQYTVTLDATFETHVPAPVVTADPTLLDLTKLQYDSQGRANVNYTLTNHGFIGANNTRINFASDALYTFTPLVSNVGTIPAMSSVVVPVTITRAETSASTSARMLGKTKPAVLRSNASGSGSLCGLGGNVLFDYICGGTQTGSAPLGFITGEGGCTGLGLIDGFFSGGFGGFLGFPIGFPIGVSTSEFCSANGGGGGGSGGGGSGGGGSGGCIPAKLACLDFTPLLNPAIKVVNDALDGVTKDSKFDAKLDLLNALACATRCCKPDGSSGYGVSVSGKLKLEGGFVDGFKYSKKFSNITIVDDVKGLGRVHADIDVKAFVGAKFTAEGSIQLGYEKGCDKPGCLTASGEVSLGATAGVQIKPTVDLLDSHNFKVGNAEIDLEATMNTGVSLSIAYDGCSSETKVSPCFKGVYWILKATAKAHLPVYGIPDLQVGLSGYPFDGPNYLINPIGDCATETPEGISSSVFMPRSRAFSQDMTRAVEESFREMQGQIESNIPTIISQETVSDHRK